MELKFKSPTQVPARHTFAPPPSNNPTCTGVARIISEGDHIDLIHKTSIASVLRARKSNAPHYSVQITLRIPNSILNRRVSPEAIRRFRSDVPLAREIIHVLSRLREYPRVFSSPSRCLEASYSTVCMLHRRGCFPRAVDPGESERKKKRDGDGRESR